MDRKRLRKQLRNPSCDCPTCSHWLHDEALIELDRLTALVYAESGETWRDTAYELLKEREGLTAELRQCERARDTFHQAAVLCAKECDEAQEWLGKIVAAATHHPESFLITGVRTLKAIADYRDNQQAQPIPLPGSPLKAARDPDGERRTQCSLCRKPTFYWVDHGGFLACPDCERRILERMEALAKMPGKQPMALCPECRGAGAHGTLVISSDTLLVSSPFWQQKDVYQCDTCRGDGVIPKGRVLKE